MVLSTIEPTTVARSARRTSLVALSSKLRQRRKILTGVSQLSASRARSLASALPRRREYFPGLSLGSAL